LREEEGIRVRETLTKVFGEEGVKRLRHWCRGDERELSLNAAFHAIRRFFCLIRDVVGNM